jgi:hypothetical protein
VSVVGATLATMRNQVTSTITDLSNLNPQGELQDAFDEADSCKSVRQGSS